MNWLAENALPIWMGGAIALTMAMIVFLQTRTNRALAAVGVVIGITALLLALEYFLETPREAINRRLYELAETVEANDVPGALRFLAPSFDSQIRSDIETLMPLVKIDRARIINTPKIELAAGSDPTEATVECRGVVLALDKQSGMKGAAEDDLVLYWVRQGDEWFVKDYQSKRNWHRALGRQR